MSIEKPSEVSPIPELPQASADSRVVSERKRKANRNNALRSTGPKTVQGKRNASRNARKHGILAREVVITAGDGKESPEDFSAFLKRLQEHYEPLGIVEAILVQKIATCLWRTARVLRAENGEIRTRLDTIGRDRVRRDSDENYRIRLLVSGVSELYPEIINFGKISKTNLRFSETGHSTIYKVINLVWITCARFCRLLNPRSRAMDTSRKRRRAEFTRHSGGTGCSR